MLDLAKIEAAIQDVVTTRFSDVNITRMDVLEGEDHDGERSFFISVVFDGDLDDFDKSKLTGITRHQRSRLAELGEERFPYTRFVDVDELDEEAA